MKEQVFEFLQAVTDHFDSFKVEQAEVHRIVHKHYEDSGNKQFQDYSHEQLATAFNRLCQAVPEHVWEGFEITVSENIPDDLDSDEYHDKVLSLPNIDLVLKVVEIENK